MFQNFLKKIDSTVRETLGNNTPKSNTSPSNSSKNVTNKNSNSAINVHRSSPVASTSSIINTSTDLNSCLKFITSLDLKALIN